MAALPESPPHTACRLHIDYRDVPAATALATPGTLAVFGFGANAPATPTDPRYLQVALPALGRAPLECWQVDADVAYGREGGIAWAQGGGLQFGALEIADDGDVEAAAAHAYTCLRDWLASSAYAHPLRIWNYLDAIHWHPASYLPPPPSATHTALAACNCIGWPQSKLAPR